MILNFLRDPENFKVRIKDKNLLEEIKREAQYFGLEEKMFSSFAPESLDWLTGVAIHSFSTEHDSFPARNVLDSTTTYWLSQVGTVTDQWIVFDFGKNVFVNKVLIKVDNFECTVKNFSVQTVDGDVSTGTWRSLKDFEAKCGQTCTTDQIFTGFEFKGRYLRLFCKDNWGPEGGSFILITNVKFFGTIA
jgi:CO/xanthine dehydrogenase Mo-binding subunit